MERGLEYVITGILLGFSAGISPGPLMALIISKTMQRGPHEGIKVAISPIITDCPIILFVVLILSQLRTHSFIIAIISLFGAGYLIFLGLSNIKMNSVSVEVNPKTKYKSLIQGIITNLLSPHPYLFWLSIGGPVIFKTANIQIGITILFFTGFYIFLLGTKIGIAFTVGKTKTFIRQKYYLYIIRGLGIILCIISLLFIKEGLELLKII